jgi:cellulose biosynthesis protein BcsQ
MPEVAARPLTVAIAHNKGGVSKTTTTLVLGRYLSRDLAVELVDLDETRYLREMIARLSRRGDYSLGPRLWLRENVSQPADVVLIDSPPARGSNTRQALIEADYVLIPAPPEPMAVLAMELMFDVVEEVRYARQDGNPYLTILGVVPTIFDRRWPDHVGWLCEMEQACRARGVRVFPPVARRMSYMSMSVAGGDYAPVADAIRGLLAPCQVGGRNGHA